MRADLTGLSASATAASRSAGRPVGCVNLLAISKGFPPADVLALAQSGQTRFGESYLSEAIGKMDACAGVALEWHYVGRLQTRKLCAIARRFAWVHSLETIEQARAHGRARPPGAPPLAVCLQVNVDAEPGKAGVAPGAVARLADGVSGTPGLTLRGLMALPAPPAGRADRRAPFRRLAELFDALRTKGHPLDTLSMGMSADFADAIAERATLVRIGTAIFGTRE